MMHSTVDKFDEVTLNQYRRKVSPNSHRGLFVCPNNCSKNHYFLLLRNPILPQCLSISCSVCKQKWYVCINCYSQLKHINTILQYKRHAKLCHENNMFPTLQHKSQNTYHIKLKDFKLQFLREASALFFYFEQFNMGSAYIISNAHFKLPNVAELVSISDVNTQLKITKVLHSTPSSISEEMTSIFRDILDRYCSNSKIRKSPWMLSIPRNMSKARSLYLEGKYAVIPNLPHPHIQDFHDHSYVNIEEIIKHYLYSGGDYLEVPDISFYKRGLDKASNINEILKCHRCNEISKEIDSKNEHNEETLNLMLLRWSDDFEPTSSNKKNRNNGMWILTVSIVKPKMTGQHSENTFTLSMGKKGEDHQIVEDQFASDLEKFNNNNLNWYLPKNSTKKKKVRLYVFACLGDSPEKYTVSHITRGNGTYTSRWGHLIDIKSVQDVIPSCKDCRKLNILQCGEVYCGETYSCRHCVNWDFYKDEYNLLLFDPPNKFPKGCSNSHSNKLAPQKITSRLLLSVCENSHTKISEGIWSRLEGDAYLKAHGINIDLRQNIIECAENIYLLSKLNTLEHRYQKYLTSDKERNPNKYIQHPLPKVWFSPTGVELFVDAPMHLLFLGIMKDVHRITMQWCSTINIESTVLRQISKYFNIIFEMKLEWLKIIPIGISNFSGWVSENWLALSRISKWIYSIVVCLYSTKRNLLCSFDGPRNKWTMNQNKSWLKTHGLDTRGNAVKLRERVDEYMNDSSCPLPFNMRPGGSLNNLMSLWSSLHAIISNCMCRQVTSKCINQVAIYIKIFLSAINDIDKYLSNSNSTRLWFSSWNYITLLNIPETLKKYGSFQNIWEGGTVGEGILKDVKPLSTYVYAKWYMHLTTKLYQTRSLNAITKTSLHRNNIQPYIPKNVHTYRNSSEIFQRMANGEPLSLVCVDNSKFFVLLDNEKTIELIFDYSRKKISAYHTYFFCKQTLVHDDITLDSDGTLKYGILLPLFDYNNERRELVVKSKMYTLVFSNWTEINYKNDIGLFNNKDWYYYRTAANS